MALDRNKWIDLASATLKLAFAVVLPAGYIMVGSLLDLSKAASSFRTNAPLNIPEPELKDLTNKLFKQLRNFDHFEAKVPNVEKTLGYEILMTYIKTTNFNYATIEQNDFDHEQITANLESGYCIELQPASLSEPGFEFCLAMFRLVIRQIVAIISSFPSFENELAVQTYLAAKRTPMRLKQSLEQIIVPSARTGTPQETARYEAQYLESVIRRHGRIEQFGLEDVPPALRWQSLDVTYISLSSSRVIHTDDLKNLAHASNYSSQIGYNLLQSKHTVETAIMNRLIQGSQTYGLRMLISGSAGSGKTTVMKWLSTKFALNSRNMNSIEDSKEWAGYMPFPVNLSTAIPPDVKNIPQDTDLIQNRGSATSRPAGWLDTILNNGDAIIFFDGLDELSQDRRTIGKQWIQDISERFPKCHLIVSSRPEAIDVQFFAQNGFSLMEIQPFSHDQAKLCIAKWFDAQCDAAPVASAEIYRGRERSLESHLDNDSNVRGLAESPLLVAMLCAYYASGSSAGPIGRVKLINNVMEVLIDRRDRNRGIIPQEMITFTLERKLERLGHIARFLFELGARSTDYDLNTGRSTFGIGNRTLELESPGPGLDSSLTTKYLLERSMVFLSVGHSEARFVHAIFLEYLAGYQLAQNDAGSSLLEMHGLPGWFSVASFFSANSSGNQSQIFVEKLLNRLESGRSSSSDYRRTVYCLVECLGASRSYNETLFAQTSALLQANLPPRTDEEVALLASIGSPAIAMLPDPQSLEEAIAYLATANRVRGDAAIQMLEDFSKGVFSSDLRPLLLEAWTAFDADEYAIRVLRNLDLRGIEIHVQTFPCCKALDHLSAATRVKLGPCEGLKDLTEFGSGRNIIYLDLQNARQLGSLEGLQRMTSIRKIRLPLAGKISDLSPLHSSSSLREIYIENASSIEDLTPLRDHPSLRSLSIKNTNANLLMEMSHGFHNVTTLTISGHRIDFNFLVGLPGLETLRVRAEYNEGNGIAQIEQLVHLKHLELVLNVHSQTLTLPSGGGLKDLILNGVRYVDYDSFAIQTGLEKCSLTGAFTWQRRVYPNRWIDFDSGSLVGFRRNVSLQYLKVCENSKLHSVEGIQDLMKLRYLCLSKTNIMNLYGESDHEPWSISECRALERIDFDYCLELADFSALKTLPLLLSVSLQGDFQPWLVESLMSVGPRLDVIYDSGIWLQETG